MDNIKFLSKFVIVKILLSKFKIRIVISRVEIENWGFVNQS